MESQIVHDNNVVQEITSKIYPSAVIYVLQCIDNYYYIGSTINHPRFRLNNHKNDSNKYPDRRVYDHILKIGWPNVMLQIVEEYPCNTKKELQIKEDQYIKESIHDEYCLNHIRANVSPQERKENVENYYLTHREQILQQHKTYIEANKQKVNEYKAAYRKDNAESLAEKSRKYAAEHAEQVKAAKKAYYEANKEERIAKQKAYVELNKEVVKQRKRAWAIKNKEENAEKHKAYVEANREKIQERGKIYYEANKDAIQERIKTYREANADKIKAQQKAYAEKKRVKLSESHICECGRKYTAQHEKRHKESTLHAKYLNTINAIVS
jgi:hypothetical protein